MYNVAEIMSGFEGLIGWRQNPDPSGDQIVDLLTSSSGLHFNDVHPMLTFKNLIHIAPEFEAVTYPVWDTRETYYIGSMVTKDDVVYRAILGGAGKIVTNTEYWEIYDDFTEWLREKTNAGILSGINDWTDLKIDDETAKNLLKTDKVFKTRTDIEFNSAGRVVYKIATKEGLMSKIRHLYLHFKDAQSITFKLYAIGNETAIETKTIAYATGGVIQKVVFDWEMNDSSAYFLEYTYAGESICIPNSRATSGKYIGVANQKTSEDIADLWNGLSSIESNYGINFSMVVKCDYTDFLVEQKDSFKTFLSLKVGIEILREMIFNPNIRSNANQSNMDSDGLLYEIDGNVQVKGSGLISKYNKSLASVKFDKQGLSRICLPCKKNGVGWGVV